MKYNTDIYTVMIYRHPTECPLGKSFPYSVKVRVCDTRTFNFNFTVEPTEKMVKEAVNKALNCYILGGKTHDSRRKRQTH